jgi:hypothetical protein
VEQFSQAAENNKSVIAGVLGDWLPVRASVLEIGSGSGQHAIHIGSTLTHVSWQPTEHPDRLEILASNLARYAPSNVRAPLRLDLAENEWPNRSVDCVFSANVIHIVSEPLGERLIVGGAQAAGANGLLVLYGPFTYHGEFTTDSNREFDQWLKDRDEKSGVRSFEWVERIAGREGMTLVEDRAMPANNQCLIFRKMGVSQS